MTALRARLIAAALLAVSGMCWPVASASADTGGIVYLQTVPALAGVQLMVGEAPALTDSAGGASVHVRDLNGIAASVTMAAQKIGPRMRIGLGRVAPLPHVAMHESHLRVGLNVWSTAQVRVSTGSTGVSAYAIRAVRLRSSTGLVETIDPRRDRTIEVLARRPQLVHNELVSQPVTWSVAGVDAGPGVALTSATARFDPYGRAQWNLALQPVAGKVRITTVPATPDVQFLIEGTSTVTGADGTATAQIGDLNRVETRLGLASSSAGTLDVSLLKTRRLAPKAVHERELVAGLAVRRPVTLHFTDLNGRPVRSDRVTGASIKADATSVRLTGAEVRAPVLLLSRKATLFRGSWHVHAVRYAMTSATIDGGQAVFAGQQHFQPSSADRWDVKLSVFRIRVTTHDALLGTRVGSRLVVTRPDRSTYSATVSRSGAGAVMTSVVRGDYDLHFSAAVLGSTTSLRISRSDTIDVRVVTPLDVTLVSAVVALLGVSAALGALHVARRADAE